MLAQNFVLLKPVVSIHEDFSRKIKYNLSFLISALVNSPRTRDFSCPLGLYAMNILHSPIFLIRFPSVFIMHIFPLFHQN